MFLALFRSALQKKILLSIGVVCIVLIFFIFYPWQKNPRDSLHTYEQSLEKLAQQKEKNIQLLRLQFSIAEGKLGKADNGYALELAAEFMNPINNAIVQIIDDITVGDLPRVEQISDKEILTEPHHPLAEWKLDVPDIIRIISTLPSPKPPERWNGILEAKATCLFFCDENKKNLCAQISESPLSSEAAVFYIETYAPTTSGRGGSFYSGTQRRAVIDAENGQILATDEVQYSVRGAP